MFPLTRAVLFIIRLRFKNKPIKINVAKNSLLLHH